MAVTRTEQNRKDGNARFRQMMDRELEHVRVGQGAGDGTRVTLIAHARDAHGPEGLCTCCPRREP